MARFSNAQGSSSDPHIVYGLNTRKPGSGHHHHHHGGHYQDSTAHRRQHHSHRRHHHHHHRNTGRRIARTVLVVVLVLVALCAVGGGALFVSARSVYGHASNVSSALGSFKTAVATGDSSTANSSASQAASEASALHEETQGVVWNVAAALPVIGQDVRNVQGIAEAADTVATGALVPLSHASDSASLSNLLQDGHVDVDATQRLADTLGTVAPATQQAADTIDALTPGRIAQVNNALDDVRDQVDSVNVLASGLSKIGSNLSELLGANGQTKNYLIMAISPAEIRPAGGFVGSVGLLTITDGNFEMGEFASPAKWDPSDVQLTEGQMALQGAFEPYIRAGRFFGNSTADPNFPGAAQIANAHWMKGNPDAVELDGVVGVDPIFLQYVLGLTGGVTADDGTKVDGTNAAQQLLNGVYTRYPTDGEKQDAFLSDVASKCFDKVLDNLSSVSITDLSRVLATGAQNHNIQIWFPDANLETQVAEQLGVDGAIKTDPANPQLGVYFNSAGGTKMDWYLSDNTTLGSPSTSADGAKTYRATTTLGNHVQAGEAASLPNSVTGGNVMVVPVDRGEFATIVYLYAPAGGSISDVRCDAGTFTETTVDGFDVWEALVKIPVASTVQVTYSVHTSDQAASDLTVRSTATAQEQAGW